jgi:hypothetical protein
MAVAVYAVVVGLFMIAWWGLDLRRGAWHRGDRSHAELGLHLVAEAGTAALLVGSGIALLLGGARAERWALLALGMLLYTVVVSPGYFLARRELPPVWMFAVLAVTTLGAAAASCSDPLPDSGAEPLTC